MIINKKLFDDLFIESHKPLAIKSLQTLNTLENMLIIRSNYDNILTIFKIKNITELSKVAGRAFLLNLLFTANFDFTVESKYFLDNQDILTDHFSHSKFLIIDNCFYSLLFQKYEIIEEDLIIRASIHSTKNE